MGVRVCVGGEGRGGGAWVAYFSLAAQLISHLKCRSAGKKKPLSEIVSQREAPCAAPTTTVCVSRSLMCGYRVVCSRLCEWLTGRQQRVRRRHEKRKKKQKTTVYTSHCLRHEGALR